jgi:hypothetical protein
MGVDLVLRDQLSVTVASQTDGSQSRVRETRSRRSPEIEKHQIGTLQTLHAAQRNQARIAGTSSHEIGDPQLPWRETHCVVNAPCYNELDLNQLPELSRIMAAAPEDNGRKPIDPAKRRRLQQMFEHGNRSAAKGDFKYATEMLTQCVVGDPSNLLYVTNFIGTGRSSITTRKGQTRPIKGMTIKGRSRRRDAKGLQRRVQLRRRNAEAQS